MAAGGSFFVHELHEARGFAGGTCLATAMTMRSTALASALLLVALSLLDAACSSSSGDAGSAAQGPLNGTYSMESDTGTSPFASITFTSSTTYSYITRTCGQTGSADEDDSGDLGEDDPGDVTADDGCVHRGTFVLTGTTLTLTDDGSTTSLSVSIEPARAAVGTDALTVGTPGAATPLVGTGSNLIGSAPIGSFSVGGSTLNQTPSAPSASSTSGNGGTSLVTNGAVGAAMQWVDAKMPYCWAINHGVEEDPSCIPLHGKTCERTGAADNAAWNGYRSDCSGLVSFAWALPAPGLTTKGGKFLGVAAYIPAQDLQPGDALLRPGHHIVLFETWTDLSKGEAKVIAEPGCDNKDGAYAMEQDWSLGGPPGKTPSASWSQGGTPEGTYYAIRKNGSNVVNGN